MSKIHVKGGFLLFSDVAIYLSFTFILFLLFNSPALAFINGQSAALTIGQSDTTLASSATTQSGLSGPSGVWVANGKVYITDTNNNRILIYNSIPSNSGANADVVVGQTNFTSAGSSISQNRLNLSDSGGASSDGTSLYVADKGNNRVLIWKGVPLTNGQNADIVLGQSSSFTTKTSGCSSSQLNGPQKVFVAGNKLYVADNQNSRILIYNTIPTSGSSTPDVVVGKPNMTDCTSGTTQSRTSNIGGVYSDGSRLFVADTGNNRVLIWNSIPTTSGTNADVVLGQSSFTANSIGASSSSMNGPTDVYFDGRRLYVVDNGSNRVMIWNGIPSQNNAGSGYTLGQPDAITSSANTNGLGDDVMSNPHTITSSNNQLLVADSNNNRVLVYSDINIAPTIYDVSDPWEASPGILGFDGSVTVNSYYVAQSLEYSINGSSFYGATSADGTFDEPDEDFSFTFDPNFNNPSGNGYTVALRSANDNADVSATWFYFAPFQINSPDDNSATDIGAPTFSFSVNKQRSLMDSNVRKYQIWTKQGGLNSSTSWHLYLDNIPTDFSQVQNSSSNLNATKYTGVDPSIGNGTYEDMTMRAVYTNNSSTIAVTPKINPLQGSYAWKVEAVDWANHSEETDSRNIRIDNILPNTNNFFLSLNHIAGVHDVNLSSSRPELAKNTYTTSSTLPIFYGIAPFNSNINLMIASTTCSDESCINNFSTTTNTDSRFGINLPANLLVPGQTYIVTLSASSYDNYTELPTFNLVVEKQTQGSSDENNTALGISNSNQTHSNASPKLTALPPKNQTSRGNLLTSIISPFFVFLHNLFTGPKRK